MGAGGGGHKDTRLESWILVGGGSEPGGCGGCGGRG